MIKLYIPSVLRNEVVQRACGYCEYCRSPIEWSPEIFEVEHIRPLGSGGRTESINLAYACPACNRYKRNRLSARDPLTEDMVDLFHPRIHSWHEHFRWSDDRLTVEGITPTGRATAMALKMNRTSAQRFRQVLIAAGEHPAMK